MNDMELFNMSIEQLKELIDDEIKKSNERELEVIEKGKDLVNRILELTNQESQRTSTVVLAYMLYKSKEKNDNL